MTSGGWLVMLFSVGGVTAFFSWSMYLVLFREKEEHMHSTLDETPDMREEQD
jgi:hypothetical protein